jgi:hypothetical protein
MMRASHGPSQAEAEEKLTSVSEELKVGSNVPQSV